MSFDEIIDRRNTHCSKWDMMDAFTGVSDPDAISMWVADMDFAAAPCITRALQAELDAGYHGYWGGSQATAQVVSDWYARQHNWQPDPRHIRFSHGVIGGLGVAIAAWSDPGDGVMLFSPVYHAFYRQIEAQGRHVIEAELSLNEGRYEIDWDATEAAAAKSRIMILCTPHNPGGVVWGADDIARLGDICKKHDLVLVSDEIHMDLTFPGTSHIPAATAAPDHLDRLVVLTAASKAFNIAGGETGIAIIPDEARRAEFDRHYLDRESSANRYGITMVHAALSGGDAWLDAVRAYLAENFAVFAKRMNAIPGVSVMDMQATYLSWVDMSGTGMDDAELKRRFLQDARVAPSPGPDFGTGGTGHMRFNLALPRPTLLDALTLIETAFADLQ